MLTYDFYLDVLSLDRIVDQVKNLGILNTLLFNLRPHIEYVINKSLRILGFIQQHSQKLYVMNCLLVFCNTVVCSTIKHKSMRPWFGHLTLRLALGG